MAYKLGYNYRTHRNKDDIIKIYPFSSKVKSMTTIGKIDGEPYTFAKGAPDFMIKHCSHYVNKNGEVVPIDDNFTKVLFEKLENFAEQTLRTLLIGYKKGGSV